MRAKRVVQTLLVLLAAACTTELDDVTNDFFTTGVNSLRVEIYDGQTGQPIEGATLTIQVGPRLYTAEAQGNAYLTERLPGGDWPLSVDADGYLQFRGIADLNDTSNADDFDRNFLNRVIFMYPEGQASSDLTVRVFEGTSDTAVSGARVVVSFDADATPTNQTTFDVIAPSSSTLTSTLTGETNSDGTATFAAADLILGAEYNIGVFGAATADGSFLSSEEIAYTVGEDFSTVVLFLDEPFESPTALSANNDENGAEFQNELVVRFPYAVEICSDETDHNGSINGVDFAPYDAADDDGDFTFNSLDDDNPVAVASSENGTVLTFTFSLDAQDDPDQTDLAGNNDSLRVDFLGFEISPVGSSSCTALTLVDLRDTGLTVDTTITVR